MSLHDQMRLKSETFISKNAKNDMEVIFWQFWGSCIFLHLSVAEF